MENVEDARREVIGAISALISAHLRDHEDRDSDSYYSYKREADLAKAMEAYERAVKEAK